MRTLTIACCGVHYVISPFFVCLSIQMVDILSNKAQTDLRFTALTGGTDVLCTWGHTMDDLGV